LARLGSSNAIEVASLRFVPRKLRLSSIRAKGLRRPKLRSDLRVSQQKADGTTSYIIKIQETNSYNRFGKTEFEILTLCDGTRTAADLAEAISARHPEIALSESHVIDFLDSVEPEMWERSTREQNQALLERLREEHKHGIDHASLLNIRFKPWNPNQALTVMEQHLGWMFTRGFVAVSVGLFLIALHLLIANWAAIVQDMEALYSLEERPLYSVCLFWVLLLAFEAIHELAHGVVCKHFGGEVPEMGFSLVYFTPSFYLDTTDMVLFNRRERLWVIFAGIWIELVICGLATLLWHLTLSGTFINDLAYKVLLLSGLDTLGWNLNPLIQADGYYALADYLEVDNLAESSLEFVGARVRKSVFREDVDLPAVTERRTRIFWAYGLASIVYSITVTILILIFARSIFTGLFGNWGEFFTLGLTYFLLRKRLGGVWNGIRAWLARNRKARMAWKLTRVQQGAVAGVAFLFFIPPLPFKVASDFVLEPGKKVSLRSKVDGKVSQIFVHEGDVVNAGQVLGVLENPEVEARAEVLLQELDLAGSSLRTNSFLADTERSAQARREQWRYQSELAVARERKNALVIRAPIDGTVTTAALEQKLGQFLPAGNEFCQIADRTSVRARLLVRDWDLAQVDPGANVDLKALAFPFRTYSGRVAQILPAASLDRPVAQPEKIERMGQEQTNYFALVVELPNTDDSLREGMTGTAKIRGKNRPLAWQAGRGAWHWFRGIVW
jgi:putative peptide zinc metalloprotease protein